MLEPVAVAVAVGPVVEIAVAAIAAGAGAADADAEVAVVAAGVVASNSAVALSRRTLAGVVHSLNENKDPAGHWCSSWKVLENHRKPTFGLLRLNTEVGSSCMCLTGSPVVESEGQSAKDWSCDRSRFPVFLACVA